MSLKYPQRPEQPECRDYLRTGRCKYGESCKYHHPLDIPSGGGMRPSKPGEPLFPVRPDEPVCSYYIKHGTCKFGQTCKFNHPPQPKLAVGEDVLPQRLEEPDCIYFLRNGRCKYGPTCKYHHPLDGRRRSLSGSSDSTSHYYNGPHPVTGQPTKLFVTESGSQVMMVGRGGAAGYDYGSAHQYGYGPPPPAGVGSPMMSPMGVVSVPSSYETSSSGGMGSYPGEGWYAGGSGEGFAVLNDGTGQGLPSLYPPALNSSSAFSNGVGNKPGEEGKWSTKFGANSTTNSTASTSSRGTSSPLGELSPTSAPWEGNIASVPSVPTTSVRNNGDGGITPVFSNETATVNTNSTWSVDGSPSLAPSSGGSCTDIDSKEEVVEGERFDQGINNMTSALLDILDFSDGGAGGLKDSNGGGGGSNTGSGPQHLRQGCEGSGPGPALPHPRPLHQMQQHNQNQGLHQFVNMHPQYGQQQQQQQQHTQQGGIPHKYYQQQPVFYPQQHQNNDGGMHMHGHPPLHPGMNHMEEAHPVPPFKGGPRGLRGNIFDSVSNMGPPPIPPAPPTWAAQVMGGERG